MAVEVSRLTRETLAKLVESAEVLSQGVNVLMNDPSGAGTGNVEVSRMTRETGFLFPADAEVLSQGVNVLMDDPSGAGTGLMVVSRMTREILGRCVDVQTAWTPTMVKFFAHNWADRAVLRTGYQTDVVQASETLAEKRRILIDRPERQLKLRWTEAGRSDVDEFLVQLRRFNQERMTIPLYMDQIEVTATSPVSQNVVNADFSKGRYFKNTPVVIVEIDYLGRPVGFETNVIDVNSGSTATMQVALASTLEPGSHVIMPLIRVREVLRVNVDNLSDRAANVIMEVDEVLGPNAIPASTCDAPPGLYQYKGDPIFCPDHDWVSPLRVSFIREGRVLRQGRAEITHRRGTRHRVQHDVRFTVDRADMWQVFRFFDSRRGRARPFWLLDMENLWEVVDHVGGTAFLGIDPLNSFTAFQDEMAHIGLEYNDGLCSVHEVITIQDVGGQWRLTLLPGDELPAGKTKDDVFRVGRARLCRNQSDEFVEEWQTTEAIQFNMRVIELFNEGDVTT